MEALLAERASGPLQEAEAAALDRHLEGCPQCRAAQESWDTLFSLVALPPPKLKEEAAMRDFSERTLRAWRRLEERRKRLPALVGGGLAAAAAVMLVLWHTPQLPRTAGTPVALTAERTPSLQLEWTDGPTWEMDESEAVEASSDEAVLDGLALEGDGAFSLGDSG
jgi:anti-sigma factor RsiW